MYKTGKRQLVQLNAGCTETLSIQVIVCIIKGIQICRWEETKKEGNSINDSNVLVETAIGSVGQ